MKKLFFPLIFLILTACGQADLAPTGDSLFVNISTQAGIVNNRLGKEKTIGQAWGDYDQDGWLDLYVTDMAGPNTLYHNNGDGTFSVSPFSRQVSLPDAYSGGATFADYNNDGWPDLYVVNWGPNYLFYNQQGRGFANVTDWAGVAGNENSQSASWGDYDEDGWLDLYVANWACYPRCGRPSSGEIDRFYHNNGNGTFTEVTNSLSGKTTGSGFVASFVDYDNDGDSDIYLVNDEFIHPVGNALWRNDGPGCEEWCWTDVSTEAGANTKVMGMGLAIGDYNNDGYLDFYFSNAGPMKLLQNLRNGAFANVAEAAGVEMAESIGWGAVFFDYDNDGWQDLYLAVMEKTTQEEPADPLLHNERDGTFTNMGASSGLDVTGRTLGVAYGDYDQDGRLDLVVGHYDEPYELYRNQTHTDNHWLALQLVGGGPVNRDAVGTRVYVTTDDGRTQLQEVTNGSSLGAGNALDLHFGLGQARVESLEVVWTDGTRQTFRRVPMDQAYRLVYPAGESTRLDQYLELYGGVVRQTAVLLLLLAAGLLTFLVWRMNKTRRNTGLKPRAINNAL